MDRREFIARGELDAVRDSRFQKKCQNCIWLTYDMDGNFCRHQESLGRSAGFGQCLELARADHGVCGPEGLLWEKTVDKQREGTAEC